MLKSQARTLATEYPEISAQWHPTKNGDLKPSDVAPKSHTKIWWLCSMGHEWLSSVAHRTIGQGCPFCSNKKVLCGFNDFAHVHPDLLCEWNYERNIDVTPESVVSGSEKSVWWKCSICGHEWRTKIYNRSGGKGCPACSGKVVVGGVNDFAHVHPELLSEWNTSRNGALLPNQVSVYSNRKVWWKCSRGHEWEASVGKRSAGQGCPFCSNKRVLEGFNDFAHVHPELLLIWDYERNLGVSPKSLVSGSERKVWWKCDKGHSYQMKLCAKVSGYGCPICSHQQITIDNCLATLHPELLDEWDFEKNIVSPQDIAPSAHKKVWWKCQYGHSYQAFPYSKVGGRGCPKCDSEKRTSFAEQAIGFYLGKHFHVERRAKIAGFEVDVYIPDLRFAIEYDGCYFHSSKKAKKREERKNRFLRENEIHLVRVKETKGKSGRKGDVIYDSYDKDYSALPITLSHISDIMKESFEIDIEFDVDITRDKSQIMSLYAMDKKNNSLAARFPKVAEKWDYEKNVGLTPDMVDSGSGKRFWWKCRLCGYGWYGSVGNQTNTIWVNDDRCPKCCRSRKKRDLTIGYTLETQYPKLAREWFQERNGDLKPSDVTPGSHKSVWWRCEKCGHVWQKKINERVRRSESGCLKCSRSALPFSFEKFLGEFRKRNVKCDTIEFISEFKGLRNKIDCRCKICGYKWSVLPYSLLRGTGCRKCGFVSAGTKNAADF